MCAPMSANASRVDHGQQGLISMHPTWYPAGMKKTSLYLEDTDVARPRRLAATEGRSQAQIVRAAIAAYDLRHQADRSFALAGAWEGDGTSIANIHEEDLLRGFGT